MWSCCHQKDLMTINLIPSWIDLLSAIEGLLMRGSEFPYSLRRSKEGNILLFALRHESKEWRAYRVDRIQGAEVTQTSFVPAHAVELTPAGPISMPELSRSSGRYDGFKSTIPRSSSKRWSFGPTYVIECPYCGKKFSRKKMNARLNPHKDKHGYPYSGRNGYLVDTKY